jgi:HK97 family phage prohead protease
MIAPESRAYVTTLELRDVQAVGKPYRYLEGRAVPYDTFADLGWFLEQHAAGSFAQSTKAGTGKGLPLLLFHDNRSFPIGKAESWKHDDGALDGVWRLNDSAEAQRAAGAADAGELVGLSIGFAPIRSDWQYVDDWNPDLGADHKDRVTRLESRLLEVSLTPTPAFLDAEVAVVRTAFSVEQRQAAARTRPLEVDTWRAELDALRSAPH